MPLQGGLTVLVLGGHQGKGQGATTWGGGCHWALEALSSRPKLEGAGELFSVLWMQEAIHGIPLAPIPQFMEEEMRGPERQSDFPKATQPSTPLSLSLSVPPRVAATVMLWFGAPRPVQRGCLMQQWLESKTPGREVRPVVRAVRNQWPGSREQSTDASPTSRTPHPRDLSATKPE